VFQTLNHTRRTSQVSTICLWDSWSALKVWKIFLNPLFAARNWISSISSTSVADISSGNGPLIVLNAINIFIGEFFGGKIRDAGSFSMSDNVLADGMEQMRFAQPDSAVKEQRIV